MSKKGSRTRVCARPECENSCESNTKYCSEQCRVLTRPTREEKRMLVEDRFLDMARDYIQANPRAFKLPPVKLKKTHASPHEMVLMLSDAHYPEVVDPDVAMGLKYDGDICIRRLERVRNVVLRYKQLRETSYPIRKLTVAMLGDMLSGDIHEELEVTNQIPMAEALVKLAYVLNDMFVSFAKEFPEVEVVVIPGNHPRQTKKPRYKQKTVTNFEYILGHFIASLAGNAYTVQVPKDIVYRHKVFDYTLAMNHGDGQKSNSYAGLPFYGIKQRLDALQSLLRFLKQNPVDYLLLGHFHQPSSIPATDAETIINGSIKGGDEFSIGSRFAANNPTQLLLTFHEKHGLTDTSKINLGGVV